MDSQGIAHQYYLRADARGYAIDIVPHDDARLPFVTVCDETRDRADPQTNAQRGQLAAQVMGITLTDVKVSKDLGVCLYATAEG